MTNIQPNAGWLNYRKYFCVSSREELVGLNEELYKNKIFGYDTDQKKTFETIDLVTIYPGLLTGSGYGHDYKNPEDQVRDEKSKLTPEAFKIGFYFDHTTGMPVIPGSSVKGLLRSAFPQRILKKTTKRSLQNEFSESRDHYIRSLLDELGIKCDISVDDLENEIFHGMNRQNKSIPVYGRDVFYDAWPLCIPENNYNNREKRIFASDYITPHKHTDDPVRPELDPFSDPNPIKFLKVMPGVVYRFSFRLHNSILYKDIITSDVKKQLFQRILCTLGIGAKTNVGYGQFVPFTGECPDETADEPHAQYVPAAPHSDPVQPESENPVTVVRDHSRYKKGDTPPARVKDITGGYYSFSIGDDILVKSADSLRKKFEDLRAKAEKKGRHFTVPELKPGDTVTIRINNDFCRERKEFTVIPSGNRE
ncbi:MAG: type III-B CRISPR module RAMP protein Cmr6 [Bacteroidales bacterium]|nr:type III-B CRISPR module RAMP protein Cmr6 [Bacteroidales bacterium]